MKKIIARWKAESPAFFKKIAIWAASLSSIPATLLSISALPHITLPAMIINTSTSAFTFLIGIAAVAKLTVNDPDAIAAIDQKIKAAETTITDIPVTSISDPNVPYSGNGG